MSDDLVKRGRFLAEMLETDKYEAHLDNVGWVTHQIVTAMVDRIEALEAGNAALRVALNPFAWFSGCNPNANPHKEVCRHVIGDNHYVLSWKVFHKARALLEKEKV